jgi:uncharacterized membrane protein
MQRDQWHRTVFLNSNESYCWSGIAQICLKNHPLVQKVLIVHYCTWRILETRLLGCKKSQNKCINIQWKWNTNPTSLRTSAMLSLPSEIFVATYNYSSYSTAPRALPQPGGGGGAITSGTMSSGCPWGVRIDEHKNRMHGNVSIRCTS